MADITTRTGKGSKLTIEEMDNNFSNLNQQGEESATALSQKADLVNETVPIEQLPPTPLSNTQFEQLMNNSHQIKGSWLTNFIIQVIANQGGNINPAAPTLFIVNDVENTADWTANPDYPNISDYEYTLNGGDTIIESPELTKPLNVGNQNYAANKVGIRVKADSGRNASPWLFNATPYTQDAEPSENYMDTFSALNIYNGLNVNLTEVSSGLHKSAIDANGSVTTKYLMPYLSEIALPILEPDLGENIQMEMGLLGGYEISGNGKGVKIHNGVLYQYDGNNGEEIFADEFQPVVGDFIIARYIYDTGDPNNFNNRELVIFKTSDRGVTLVPLTLPIGRITYVNSPNGWVWFNVDSPGSLLTYPQGKGLTIDTSV